MTSHPTATFFNIAPTATTVHLHFNTPDPASTATDAAAAAVVPVRTSSQPNLVVDPLGSHQPSAQLSSRFDRNHHERIHTRAHPPPPGTPTIQTILALFNNILRDQPENTRRSVVVNRPPHIPTRPSDNTRDTTGGVTHQDQEVEPVALSQTNQLFQHSPPTFQPVISRSLNMRDLLHRLQPQTGHQDTPIAVSVEIVSTSGEEVHSTGMSVSEIQDNTTFGLYSDITGEDEQPEDGQSVAHDNCSVCQEQYQDTSIIRQVDRCGHIFHLGCIDKWLTDHRKCPVCMQSVIHADDANRNTEAGTTQETDNHNHNHNHTAQNTQQSAVEERLFNLVASEMGI
jgi:hypothetical protein